jgi:hypothetical protein
MDDGERGEGRGEREEGRGVRKENTRRRDRRNFFLKCGQNLRDSSLISFFLMNIA